MKNFRRILFTGIIITVTSQLYLNFFIDGFRVSTSVIIFPILLFTFSYIDSFQTAMMTSILVFTVRFFILILSDVSIIESVNIVYPGSIFYIFYGAIFKFKRLIKKNSIVQMFIFILLCDFLSNTFEYLLRIQISFNSFNFSNMFILFIIAATRTAIAVFILTIIRNYKILLSKEEHEKRYHNLILLISSLKSETYFMRKTSEEIENIMMNSYKLYELLSKSNNDDEVIDLSLNVAKDIHEIKKDYLRIINGIEKSMEDEIQLSEMSIKDIFYILKENTLRVYKDKINNVHLDFKYEENFTTKNHFQLMSIFRNLVNNSIESMDLKKKINYVSIQHKKEINYHIFIIKDSGRGITKENINYIYNPGFSTKFDYDTGDIYRGIGLSHVKALVTKHFNGTISATSEKMKGTVFVIKIPISKMEVIDENIYC